MKYVLCLLMIRLGTGKYIKYNKNDIYGIIVVVELPASPAFFLNRDCAAVKILDFRHEFKCCPEQVRSIQALQRW